MRKLCVERSFLIKDIKFAYAWWQSEQFSQKVLDGLVELHKAHICKIPEEKDQGFPPVDVVVHEKQDKNDQGYRVEKHVSYQRPSREAAK